MSRGGRREGAGRPAGSANKKTREIADRAAEQGVTPLAYMLGVLANEDSTEDAKRWAAQNAAPYVHPKLAAIQHTGKDGGPIQHAVNIYIPANGRD